MPHAALVDKFKTEVKNIKDSKFDDKDACKRALRALHYALNETQHYYKRVIEKQVGDSVIEKQLHLYWQAAAMAMVVIHNKPMRELCLDPSFYFINAKSWIEENKRGHTSDFSCLIQIVSNAVGVSKRKNF
jgi:3-hydroxy-3-methylglutaryl CoA synthase